MTLGGIWLPIVTPFLNGEVDYDSYGKLIQHYLDQGISGLIPMGTTGESPVITDDEYEGILDATVAAVAGRVPVYAGLGGNHTDSVLKKAKVAEKYGIDGILSVCPYYSRPGQEGLTRHFMAVSEATDLNIVIYNIPYRTGVNMTNETLFRLGEQENVVGVKDACGDIRQSLDLLNEKPEGFSVMTGEDLLLFTTLAHGGDGGILASAHLQTDRFVAIHRLMTVNDHQGALEIWKTLQPWIPLLFAEPNPAPLKYLLARMGRIASAEVRLPLTEISTLLQRRLNETLAGIH
ncbi:MAG: 4-hydroxy-tetrahydrodipicolinate synthase [Desulfobacterales bacterium]|nr:4-hydroxy-tetrahydrodipicolinate synthase [Desulfobacterales bacterium]